MCLFHRLQELLLCDTLSYLIFTPTLRLGVMS